MRADHVLVAELRRIAAELPPQDRHITEAAAARLHALAKSRAPSRRLMTMKSPVMNAPSGVTVQPRGDRHDGR